MIPVFGLSGIEENTSAFNLGSCSRPRGLGRSFMQYANKLNGAQYRKAVIKRHEQELARLDGIYNVSYRKVTAGTATSTDFANMKKAHILINLNDTDYTGYRIAKVILPYAVDIDGNDGGYLFDNYELAKMAAEGEEHIIEYLNTPGATEIGFENELTSLDGKFKNFLKKVFVNPVKAVGKATATVVKTTGKAIAAAAKSTVNATKAGLNVLKATGQLVTGNAKGAGETMKKVANNLKDSIIEPIKTAVDNTKDLWKDTVVNPTVIAVKNTRDILKETMQIAGKVFKVIFIKINPVTVLIRSSLRGLISLNFLGLATRLNVGLLTEAQAAQLGYDKETWQKAVKAAERAKKLFKKMGGNPDKLVKSIINGASKKPLFKKDVDGAQRVNLANSDTDDGETTLGDPASIATMIATCLSIIITLWNWVSSIVKANQQKKADEKAQEEAIKQQQAKKEEYEKMLGIYANDGQGNFYTDADGRLLTWEEYEQLKQQTADSEAKKAKNKKLLLAAAIGVTAVSGFILISNKKKSK